jgi:hypothetical protein
VLGPLAAAAIGAAQGALLGGGVGAVLGHFVANEHVPKYERIVSVGKYLVVVHGTEDDVAPARDILTEAGSTDVQRHDTFRSGGLGPIRFVQEGMRVVDASGRPIGKVELVRLGDPDAVTARGQETVRGEPRIGGEPRELLQRLGFVKVDRKGLLRSDAYVAGGPDRPGGGRHRPPLRHRPGPPMWAGPGAPGRGRRPGEKALGPLAVARFDSTVEHAQVERAMTIAPGQTEHRGLSRIRGAPGPVRKEAR